MAGMGGDLKAMQEMMANAMKDPETAKAINSMTENIQKAMGEMGNADPAALQAQMEEAMKLMASGDIMESVIDKKDEVLATLEQTGLVSADELAKYKADPNYFEEQMRGAFSQMKGLLDDPSLLSGAMEGMQGMQKAMEDPVMKDLQDLLMADKVTDLQIETLRLKFLQQPDLLTSNPMFAGMADEVKDEAVFQKGFMEARGAVKQMMEGAGAAMMGGGAGVGEL